MPCSAAVPTRVMLIAEGAPRAEAEDALAELGAQVDPLHLEGDPVARARAAGAPNVILVDADERVDLAMKISRACKGSELLHQTPLLCALPPTRLDAYDPSAGADDFLLKPILAGELYARIRQAEWHATQGQGTALLKSGDLVLNLAGWEATLYGRHIYFTRQEFDLLRFLMQHRGSTFSREQLLKRVWGYSYHGGARTVDIHVRRVRAKLAAGLAERLQTVRGVGYKWI